MQVSAHVGALPPNIMFADAGLSLAVPRCSASKQDNVNIVTTWMVVKPGINTAIVEIRPARFAALASPSIFPRISPGPAHPVGSGPASLQGFGCRGSHQRRCKTEGIDARRQGPEKLGDTSGGSDGMCKKPLGQRWRRTSFATRCVDTLWLPCHPGWRTIQKKHADSNPPASPIQSG